MITVADALSWGRTMKWAFLLAGAVTLGSALPGVAAETIIYTCDAQGRLVKVESAGTVNNGVTTTYSQNKAGNRTSAATSGPA